MLHVVARDNGKGKSYSLSLDYQPKMWRDGTNVKIKADYGEVHTAVFNSEYKAALYIRFTEYTINKANSDVLAGEVNQCFRTDLWSPNANNTGYGFVLRYLMLQKGESVDFQEFRDEVVGRANERWRNQSDVEIITDGSYSWSFIHYVLRAMKDVGHITIDGGRIALTSKKDRD